MTPEYVNLLIEIFQDLPRLDGAVCSGRAKEWTLLPWKDAARGPQAARAIAECKRCPALRQCRMLLDGMDNPPVDMIQAGRIITSGTSLSRKASSTPGKSSWPELVPSP